jgi:hypothetical protein
LQTLSRRWPEIRRTYKTNAALTERHKSSIL